MAPKPRFLIVSGPTREPIDPVRFISNYSTGMMGRYLVRAAKTSGGAVTHVECPRDAETAKDLLVLLKKKLPAHDVLVMAAAVSDVRPQKAVAAKIKKESLRRIKLVKNPDVVGTLARRKRRGQVFVGFGLESSGLIESGLKKMDEKKLDLILVQRVSRKKSPFGEAKLEAVLLGEGRAPRRFRAVGKKVAARILIGEARKLFDKIKGSARWPRS